MDDGHDLYNWIVTGIVASGGLIISYLMNRSILSIDDSIKEHGVILKDHGEKHAKCALELADFKTEVSKEYAKDENMQQTLARLHERIDRVGDKVDEIGGTLTSDIKAILGKLK